jgi:hypothetical protein
VAAPQTAEQAASGLERWTFDAASSATLLGLPVANIQPKVFKAVLLELAVRGVLLFEPEQKQRFREHRVWVTLVGDEPDDPALGAVVAVFRSMQHSTTQRVTLKEFALKLGKTYPYSEFIEKEVRPALLAAGLVTTEVWSHVRRKPWRLLYALGPGFLTEAGEQRKAELEKWLWALGLPSGQDPAARLDMLARAGTAPLLLKKQKELERWLRSAYPTSADTVVILNSETGHGDHGQASHHSHGALNLGTLHGLDLSALDHLVAAVDSVHHAADSGHGGGHDGGGGGHH